MELYDDIDTKPRSTQIDGWSSGIKMLQTQLAIKKAQTPRDPPKKPLMTPVVSLRAKKSHSEDKKNSNSGNSNSSNSSVVKSAEKISSKSKPETQKSFSKTLQSKNEKSKMDEWDFVDEYNPLWPNAYEKLKEKQQSKRSRGRSKPKTITPNLHSSLKFSGFSQRVNDEENYSPPTPGSLSNIGGAAIAPPPSLQEISINNENGDGSSNVTIPYSASSVAAKIMAKYGFKDGQGLGKQEQGMSMALQVEKTSKRGGRIIHEKDVFMPPPPPPVPQSPAQVMAPPASPFPTSIPITPAPPLEPQTSSEPSITEIMKAPSKVVILKNMVGPGDVDEELEPEVKDECNTKYGEVVNVVIHEVFGTAPEEAVKIFVEFKRMESAIKAVVDLNGRFFGGRQVRAGFFNFDKFKSFQLH